MATLAERIRKQKEAAAQKKQARAGTGQTVLESQKQTQPRTVSTATRKPSPQAIVQKQTTASAAPTEKEEKLRTGAGFTRDGIRITHDTGAGATPSATDQVQAILSKAMKETIQQSGVPGQPTKQRFSGFQIGGQQYGFDAQGTFVKTGDLITDTQGNEVSVGQVIGIEETGRQVSLGDFQERAGLQQNTVMGANPGGTLTRAESMVDVLAAAQAAQKPTLDGELSGQDKLQKLMQAGLHPASQASAPTLTSAELGSMDFASNMNLFENAPTMGDNEDPKDFNVRKLTFERDQVTDALNKTMGSIQTDKLARALKEQQARITGGGRAKTLGQFKDGLKNDPAINQLYKQAKTEYASKRNAEADAKVLAVTKNLKGSTSAVKAIADSVRKQEEEKAKSDIESFNAEMASQKKKTVNDLAQKQLQSENDTIARLDALKQMTPEERAQALQEQERNDLIQQYTNKVNPLTGDLYSPLQAKAQADKIISSYGKDPTAKTDKQRYAEFSDFVAGGGVAPQDLSALFDSARNYSENNNIDARKLVETLLSKDIANAASAEWMQNKGFDEESINNDQLRNRKNNILDGGGDDDGIAVSQAFKDYAVFDETGANQKKFAHAILASDFTSQSEKEIARLTLKDLDAKNKTKQTITKDRFGNLIAVDPLTLEVSGVGGVQGGVEQFRGIQASTDPVVTTIAKDIIDGTTTIDEARKIMSPQRLEQVGAEMARLSAEASVGRERTPIQAEARNLLSAFNMGELTQKEILAQIGVSNPTLKAEFNKQITEQGGKRVFGQDSETIADIQTQIGALNELMEDDGALAEEISGIFQGFGLDFGDRGDALTLVSSVLSSQTLNALAEAKGKGITFGALSTSEVNLVKDAAGRLAARAKKNEEGEITGFRGSEAAFKKDVKTLIDKLTKSVEEKTTKPEAKQQTQQYPQEFLDLIDGYQVPAGQRLNTEKLFKQYQEQGGTQSSVIDTGIPSVLGGNVKLSEPMAQRIKGVQNDLATAGIDLKIADSTRSTEVQRQAFESGKAGVAPPGASFHETGEAIDLSQTGSDNMKNEAVFAALRAQGLKQHPSEWWHWSFGEFT